jgi:hypothetical protein
MHPAGSEHDCRGNADHPAIHALAFRGWLIPSELHYPISMDHNRGEYLAMVPVPPCDAKLGIQRPIVPNLFVAVGQRRA